MNSEPGAAAVRAIERVTGVLPVSERQAYRVIGQHRSDPGSPWQNGIVESFNGRLRNELRSSEISDTLVEAR